MREGARFPSLEVVKKRRGGTRKHPDRLFEMYIKGQEVVGLGGTRLICCGSTWGEEGLGRLWMDNQ